MDSLLRVSAAEAKTSPRRLILVSVGQCGWTGRRIISQLVILQMLVFTSVIAANFDLHRSANWNFSSRNVITKQGHNLTVTCSIAGMHFFDVLRVTHTQGATVRTLSDNANVKVPYSRIPRYVVRYNYSIDMATMSVFYNGIQGEDSGTLGCQKLGEEKDTTSYVTIKVVVPVKEVYIISFTAIGEKRLESNESELHLEENTQLGVGCVVLIDGSPILPDVRITVGEKEETGAFAVTNKTWSVIMDSGLSGLQSEVKLKMVTRKPNANFNGKILKCTATMSDFDPVVASAPLSIRYVPWVSCIELTVEAMPGSNATFVCRVLSNPGSQLRWTSGGQKKLITNGKDDCYISDKPVERDSNEATLTIVHVREHHFTTYTLKATNDIGSASGHLLLRKSASTSEQQQLWHPGRSVDGRSNPQGPKHKPASYSRNAASSVQPLTLLEARVLFWTVLLCASLS